MKVCSEGKERRGVEVIYKNYIEGSKKRKGKEKDILVGEGKEVEDMRREGEIGNELTSTVHLCPMCGSFPIQFEILLVLSGHHSILRIIRLCCLQQCLDREENCAESQGCYPRCVV